MHCGLSRVISNFLSGRKIKVISSIIIALALLLFSSYSFAGSDQTFFGPKRYNLPKGNPTVTTDNFTGCNTARQVTLKVTNGSSNYTRIQSANIVVNGITVVSDSDFNSLAPSFEKSISINSTNEIKVALNSSHEWYLDWFAQYKNKGVNLFNLLENAKLLEAKIVLQGIFNPSRDLEEILAKLQNIENSTKDCDNTLIELANSLAAGCSYDCKSISDCLWIAAHILALEADRAGLVIFRTKCIILKGLYDAAPSWSRNAEYYKKKNALEATISLLNNLNGELAGVVSHLHQLKEKIELCQTKTPFIIVEVKGNCDSTPPTLSNPQPADGAIFNNNKPALSVQYADDQQGSGIDAASVRMLLDGNDVTAGSTVTSTSVSYAPTTKLSDGQHTVVVTVADKTANSASSTWHFTIDTALPVVNITAHQNNQYLNTPIITVTGNVSEAVTSVTVNGIAAQVTGTTFSLANVALAEGINTMTVQAKDVAGNTGTASITINLDTVKPIAQITSPINNAYLNTPNITVTGTVSETVTSVTVNGVAAQITGTTYMLADVALVNGLNNITVEAKDLAGNNGSATAVVNLDTALPVVQITSPVNNSYVNTPAITVTGAVSETVQTVTVNGVAAQITGATFTLSDLNLVNGVNNITVEAKDLAGNTGTAIATINLDTALPVIQITSPANSSNVNTPVITVTGAVSETIQTVTVNGAAAQVTDKSFTLAGVALVNGLNNITIEAKDLAGNMGTATVSVTLDTSLPVIQITSPVNNSYVNTPAITVTGNISETVQTLTVNGVAAQVTDKSFTLAGVALVAGLNNITVETKDLAGNTGSATISVNLDTASPVIQITAPASSSNVNTPAITVTGTVNEAVQTVTVNGVAAQIMDKSFTLSGVALVNGLNNIAIEAKDLAGNIGTAAVSVNLDTALPVVKVISTVNNSYVNTPQITVTGTVSETVQIVTVNGVAAQVTDKSFTLASVTLVEGANTITVEAKDLAGNTGSVTIIVNLDTALPVIQMTSPVNNSYVNTPAITVTGSLNEAVQTVTINGVAAQVTDKSFTLANVTLVEGANTITVEARDLAGNIGAANAVVNLDTALPVVQITSPANNSYVNTQAITVTGTVSEAVTLVTVNGVAAQVTDKSFTLASMTLAEGANTITVEAKDLAGNTGSATAVVNLDTALPVIQVTSQANDAYVNTQSITITGTVSENVNSVTVNGIQAQLTGTSFSLAGISLADGANNIIIQTTDMAGNVGTVTNVVHLDTAPPAIQITSPAANLYLNTPAITVNGTVEAGTVVTVNGLTAQVTGTSFSLAGVPLVEGANTITAQARDSAGNTASNSVAVNLDTVAPVVQVTAPAPNTYMNTQVIAVTGTVSKPVVSLNVNGNAAYVTGTTFRFNGLTLNEGQNAIVVEAKDQAGNIGIQNIPVVLDSAPPVIQVSAPANNSYVNTPVITITGVVNDLNLSGFWINNAVVPINNGNFSLANFSLISGANVINFKAKDLAGNESSSTVTVNYDAGIPVVGITAPKSGIVMNTPQITVTGTISKAVAAVTINGAAAQITGTSFSLAGLTLAEGQNTIAVTATDHAGNTGMANATVTLDTTPPTVTTSAPSQAAAGANISISGTATDNLSLNVCELLVNNGTVWSSNMNAQTSASNNIAYTFSSDIAQGTVVNVQSRCSDTAGNTGTASAQITISRGPSGPGYIQGQIYHDAKGLHLDSAQANIYDANGQGLTQIITEGDGKYFYQAASGNYILILAKDGFTSVERSLQVRPEKNAVALDARLTPVSAVQNLIGTSGGTAKTAAVGEGAGSAGAGIELNIPANAVTQQTDIRLTPISNQGLAGALPAGWSPIAAVDISCRNCAPNSPQATFNQAATLTLPLSGAINFAPSSTVTLLSYDKISHQWLVSGSGAVSPDSSFITAAIPATSQYAVVVPDNGLVPQSMTNGQPLPAFSVTSATDGITASGQVIPSAAPPSVGLKAVGEVILTPGGGALHSGLIVKGRVAERFDLLAGGAIVPADYIQDIILYQYPCITNIKGASPANAGVSTINTELGSSNATGKLGASFPVTPSREFTIIDLLAGKVRVEISLPATEQKGIIVGTEGARIADAEGNILLIPQNALTQSTPVEMKMIQPALVSGIAGADFTLQKALEINLSNITLTQTAHLSMVVPDGFNPGLPVIVAKQIDIHGASKLKLVALTQVSGSLITSVSLPGGGGVTTSGRYYFLQAKEPLGYVKGKVTDIAAAAYPGALVTTDTCSLVDLTQADGNYLIASTVSGFTAKAVDIDKYDEGMETGLMTSEGQTVTVNITVRVTPPSVVSVTYTDSGKGIEPNTSITITFREPLDKTTVTTGNIVLKDSAGNIVAGSLSMNAAGNIVTLYPASLLTSQARYTLTLSKNIKDLQGYLMGADVVKEFTIRDTTPPTPPPAGSITGTFPDAAGYVTITATQGSADPGLTVLIMNETNGMVVSVTPATNGSFTGRIPAMLGDDIKILMMDSSGNTTQISYITFKNAEGKYLVTNKGGTVEGEGGTKLIIPEGALPGPTIIKITPVLEANLPQAVPAGANFLAAVNIDASGATFQKPIKLSVPVPANMPAITDLRKPFVAHPDEIENADGAKEKVYVIDDSLKVIDGRLTTASPPFDGIGSLGVVGGFYVMVAPFMDVSIFTGYTYVDLDGSEGYLPGDGTCSSNGTCSDRPVSNAIVRAATTWNYVSYSNEDGHYSILAPVVNGDAVLLGDTSWSTKLTAINPLTMYRVSFPIWFAAGSAWTNFNLKLGDKNTVIPDHVAPSISMNMSVVPGQTIPGLKTPPQFVAGTIPVGTNIKFDIRVVDQGMGTANLETIYTSVDGKTTQSYYSQLPLSRSDKPNSTVDVYGQSLYIWEYTAQPAFSFPIAGSPANYFRPDKPGTYMFTIYATDAANPANKSSKTIAVTAVDAGSLPDSIDGPPTVTQIIPMNDARNQPVSTPVTAYFSEPVKVETLKNNFYLKDKQTGLRVSAGIYTSLQDGIMTATLTPATNLIYGRSYEIILTREIKDTAINASCSDPDHLPEPCTDGGFMKLNKEYHSTFTTKVPADYDLDFDTATFGNDIALYTVPGGLNTYAYVTSGEKGWHVVNVTDPANPAVVYNQNRSRADYPWRFMSVAVAPDTGIMAMTEYIGYLGGEDNLNFGYVRFYDVKSNPTAPAIVGQARVAESGSGIPMYVAIGGNYAYISTLNVGLQIVGVAEAAIEKFDSQQPGAAIVGVLDTINTLCDSASNTKCGQPLAPVAYKNGYVLMTTMNGYTLIIDVNMPTFPTLVRAIRPVVGNSSYWRAGATSGYGFTDSSGSMQTMDLAITTSWSGDPVYVLNITDPNNPVPIAKVKDMDNADVGIVGNTEIVIDKQARQAYITAGTALYVIDIKDPYHPVLLNKIGNETYSVAKSDGSSGASEVDLGNMKALVVQNGWAYITDDTGMADVDLGALAKPPCRECDKCDERGCPCNKETNQNQCQVAKSSVNMRLGDYQKSAVDLSIKAPGGSIEVKRMYYSNTWNWGHARNNLTFKQSNNETNAVVKDSVIYNVTTPGVFINDTYQITKKTDGTGWRWETKAGDWKEYNLTGKITSDGGRTGVTASYIYDATDSSKLLSIKDRNGRTIITYEYDLNNRISAVRDIDNRRVEYTYEELLLRKVTDVLIKDTFYAYDTRNRLTKTTDPEGRVSIVNYRDDGSVASVVDGQGKGTFYQYVSGGGMTRVETSAGSVKDAWYDSAGDTVRVDVNGRTVNSIQKNGNDLIITDEAGNVTRKYYDGSDNLTKVIYPDGAQATYEYEAKFNNVTKETNEKGVVNTYQYDTNGNLLTKVEAQGTANERTTTYTYDADGNTLTIATSADANTQATQTGMTYDAAGNMRTITDPEGSTTRFTYDNMGNMLTKVDGAGKTWTFVYDAKGRLTQSTDPLSKTAQFFYDGVGNKIKDIDPSGKTTTYTYDSNNKLTAVTDANGSASTFTYDDDGRMISQTDANGKQVSYAYDADGRLTKTTDGNGNAISNVYGNAGGASCSSCSGIGTGQPSQTIFPTFTRAYTYDQRGRKTEEKDILNETESAATQFAYDAAGNLQTKTDKEQKVTSYEYDTLNRLIKVTDSLSQTTEYTYDNRDNLIALKDAKGQITRFTYDKNNRLISEKRPLGQQTGYQYNAHGQLIQKTDAKNQTSVYTYDNAGRMTQIVQTDAANNTKTINFTYGDAGNLLSYNDGTTSASYTYDNLYRKTQETTNYGAFSLTTSYSYNQNGTKKSFTYPNGTTIGYTYDANNQPLGINIPGAGSVAYNQYQWTRPQSVTLPDGGTSQYAYDELMRTKAITKKDYAANPQLNYAYTYDKMDNIKTRNTQNGNYAYNYDNLYRLNEVKKDTQQTEAYTYDQVGNRTTSKATTGDWIYNANNELLSLPGLNGQSSPATYQYDANGNTIQKTVNGQIQNYVYNADNRLIEVKDASNNTIAKYTYDPFGRRIKKTVSGGSGTVSPSGGGSGEVTTYYLYSDEGLIGEYDSTGTEIKTYGYKANSTWSTDPVFMKQGANYYFYHNDHLGTPQKMTNLSGAIVWSATYDAFGKASVDAGSTITNNLRFPGQYYDSETGWHYNGHRYYEPGTGRYVTEDPIGLNSGEGNLYQYVTNEPVNSYDEYGLWKSGEHKTLTKTAFKMVNLNANSKCREKILNSLTAANLGQDEGDAFKDNRRHYNRDIGQSVAKGERNYQLYLQSESNSFWNNLNSGNCQAALDSLGRLSHSWQDFYAHVIMFGNNSTTNKNVWTNPAWSSSRGPSSWNNWRESGEHGWSEPGGQEGSMRQAVASTYVGNQFKYLLPQWFSKCKCYCN